MINLVLLKFSGLQASQKKVFPQKKISTFSFMKILTTILTGFLITHKFLSPLPTPCLPN